MRLRTVLLLPSLNSADTNASAGTGIPVGWNAVDDVRDDVRQVGCGEEQPPARIRRERAIEDDVAAAVAEVSREGEHAVRKAGDDNPPVRLPHHRVRLRVFRPRKRRDHMAARTEGRIGHPAAVVTHDAEVVISGRVRTLTDADDLAVGLQHDLPDPPGDLGDSCRSGGSKCRVGIAARVVSHEHSLMLDVFSASRHDFAVRLDGNSRGLSNPPGNHSAASPKRRVRVAIRFIPREREVLRHRACARRRSPGDTPTDDDSSFRVERYVRDVIEPASVVAGGHATGAEGVIQRPVFLVPQDGKVIVKIEDEPGTGDLPLDCDQACGNDLSVGLQHHARKSRVESAHRHSRRVRD
jgi:hypothetical protein